MRTIIKRIIYVLPLLVAMSCDKTEEGYWPGTEPTNPLSVDVAEIRLNADGTAQEVKITAICSWDASLTDNENVFTISPAFGDGDGSILVSAGSNYGSGVKTSSLVISARELSKQVTVNIMQSSLTFEMEDKEYNTVSEEGGSVDLSFKSTTGWEFVVRANSADTEDVGSLDWFDFTPGYEGEGDYYETQVVATWKPNYTLGERVITLVLTPTNQSILEYLTDIPQPFVLRQDAGTLPTQVTASLDSVGYTDAGLTISYQSKSAVTECGVNVLDASNTIVKTVAADKTGDSYPQSGMVSVEIMDLEEGNTYHLVPYVTNMVGEAISNYLDVTTKHDGVYNDDEEYEEVVYVGVKIVDYTVIPSENVVTVSVTVSSDVNVYEGGISIYNDIYVESPLVTYTKPLEGMEFAFEVSSTDFMTPNTEYELEIFAQTDVNEARTERIKFTTVGQNPSEEDIGTPDVKE